MTAPTPGELHDRDYRRSADHWLLERGEDAVLITPDPGSRGKDPDEILRAPVGAEVLRRLIEAAVPAKLSADGWITKLGRMTGSDYELNRDRLAKEYAEAFDEPGKKVRLSFLDQLRQQGLKQARENEDEDGTARARLIAIAVEHDLFHDDGGEAFCAVELSDGAIRAYKVESAAFADLLLAEYGRRYPARVGNREIPGSVNASARSDALRSIVALARKGEIRKVFLRLGWGGEHLYLDMGTPEPRAIEITPDGWSIINDPPVHLVFSQTAKPLPVPVPGGRRAVLRQLRKFFGFRLTDDRLVLLIGIMMAGLMPKGPYPILIMTGEQGSGKTNRARFIKLAIDPTKASVRGRPRSAEDLAISVWRSWFGLFDNLSKLDQDMSDWLCRLSEGAGLPKRKLYTDTEEILIEAARPIMLTAIPDIAQSGDVIDRAVLIHCDPLPTKLREQVLLEQFEAFRPYLLGYLVEAASCALSRYGNMADVHDGLRRGDWCAWCEAAAPALGLSEGAFTETYRRNQDQSVRLAVELDAVGSAIIEFMADKHEVEITVSLLHQALEHIVRKRHDGRIPLGWSSGTNHFSGRVRRLAPMLRRIGIDAEQARDAVARSVVRLSNPANATCVTLDGAQDLRKRSSGSSGPSDARSCPGPNGPEDPEHSEDQKHRSDPQPREREVGNGPDPDHVTEAREGAAEAEIPPDNPPSVEKSRIRRGRQI